MNRPSEYTVIVQPSMVDLIRVVNEHIKAGWIPQGGIFISNFGHHYCYQAMCAYNELGPYITKHERQHLTPSVMYEDILAEEVTP